MVVMVLKRAVVPFFMRVIMRGRNVRMIMAANFDVLITTLLNRKMQVHCTEDAERQSHQDADHSQPC